MKYIGMDLGESYACISVLDQDSYSPELLNADGKECIPSVMYYGNRILVGSQAVLKGIQDSDGLIVNWKSFLGTDKKWQVGGIELSPVDLLSDLIKKLFSLYREKYSEEEYECTIACPCDYDDEKKKLVFEAAEKAGVKLKSIIDEPSAVSMRAYYGRNGSFSKNAVIFDLGGINTDISLVRFSYNEQGKYLSNIIHAKGSSNLGGKRWTERLYRTVLDNLSDSNGISQSDARGDYGRRLYLECERAKQQLSSEESCCLSVVSRSHGVLNQNVTRQDFEKYTVELMERAGTLLQSALSEGENKGFMEFDEIILTGGASSMPKVGSYIKGTFGNKVRQCDPIGAVANGAAEWCKESTATENLLRYSYGKSVLIPVKNLPSELISESSKGRDYSLVCKTFLFKGEPIPNKVCFPTRLKGKDQGHITVCLYRSKLEKNQMCHGYANVDECEYMGQCRVDLPSKILTNQEVLFSFDVDEFGKVTMTSNVNGKKDAFEFHVD